MNTTTKPIVVAVLTAEAVGFTALQLPPLAVSYFIFAAIAAWLG